MTLVGAPEKPSAVKAFNLIFKRRNLVRSPIGGIQRNTRDAELQRRSWYRMRHRNDHDTTSE